VHRLRHPLLIALALATTIAIASCGGGDGGGSSDEDPEAVLRATFSNDQSIQSGKFDLSLQIEAVGGDQPGNVDITLGGPFDGSGEGLPKFDVDADVKADTSQGNFDFTGGLTSTGDAAFVNFQDNDYDVPQELFDQFASTFTRLQDQSKQQSGQSGNFLSQLGIDPTNWLTDVQNDGTEDVDGTETVHVSGAANVQKLLDDIQTVAQNAGPAAQRLTPDQLTKASDAIKTADFDVYSGTDDDLLRKLSATIEITPPEGTAGSPDSLNVDFSLTFSDVNESQSISAPTDTQPLTDLLQQFGIDPSQLGGALRGGLGSGGLPQSGGSTAPPSSSASQAYLQCLQTAQGQAGLAQCAELLQ
jgi:hypothetical protein